MLTRLCLLLFLFEITYYRHFSSLIKCTNGDSDCEKDTFYRFLNNTKIHWERVLLFLASAVIAKIRPLTGADRLTAIVVDDSPF